MKTILLALLLTTTNTFADQVDFTRVLQLDTYPCKYFYDQTDKLLLLEATSDCREEQLVSLKRKLDLSGLPVETKIVTVDEVFILPLLLSGFLLFFGYRSRLKKD